MSDLQKEFEEIELNIKNGLEKQQDVTPFLREKVRLLNIGYENLSKAMQESNPKVIAPLFAKKLAFLNNIKTIQLQVNDDTSTTEAEIAKVHGDMRERGLGWLLDNMPAKKES